MAYKYHEIDIDTWGKITQNEVGVFGSKDFLLAIAETYNFKLLFCSVTFKDTPVLIVPLFTNRRKIVFPNHYFYQFIWQQGGKTDSWIQLDAWDVLLKELKSRYIKIKLRLPISLVDSRPFIWNNFDINVKYTYLKKLDDLNYHQNIKRIIKKERIEYSFKKDCDWEKNWLFHETDLKKFGVRDVHVKAYIKYFKNLKERELVHVFNAYYNNIFLTSIIVIVDEQLKTAYLPLIGTAEGHYNSGLPSLLYDYTFKELKSAGFDKVDMIGANIKNIAKYKSKFLPVLYTFFEVSYSKNKVLFETNFLAVKRIMGRILFWVD